MNRLKSTYNSLYSFVVTSDKDEKVDEGGGRDKIRARGFQM